MATSSATPDHTATMCANAHPPFEVYGLIRLNKGDTDMIAFFAMSMMLVTAAFAVPALMPKKTAH